MIYINILHSSAIIVNASPIIKPLTAPLEFTLVDNRGGEYMMEFTTAQGIKYYKRTSEGKCCLNVSHLTGKISVLVMDVTNEAEPSKYPCDGIIIARVNGDTQIVTVDVESQKENYARNMSMLKECVDAQAFMAKEIASLKSRITQMEGYDI
jgi:hypothetical protein